MFLFWFTVDVGGIFIWQDVGKGGGSNSEFLTIFSLHTEKLTPENLKSHA